MQRPIVWYTLVLLALLGAMAATGLIEQAPGRYATPAATGEFIEFRAKDDLATILGDQRPHPADSAASDGVRNRLVAQLQQLGLHPIVRDQFACNELFKQRGVSCARVRNVIAVLGSPTGKALLLNAHYDSTPVGSGAADDGIGVATLIEVARNLKDRPLKRPVILLFNEGEELGLIGARAFLADPLSRNVDALINLEARGVRGPVNMFETSRPNAAPIALFARAVRNPVANSLSTDVYRLLPNYTDVNSFADRGWMTLNLAPIGNETRYHSGGDDVASLELDTLHHMGSQTLALAEALGNGTPRVTSDNRIFTDVAGGSLISLPMTIGVVLLVGLLIVSGWIAFRRGGMMRASAAIVAAFVGSGLVSWVALALIGAVREGMFWRAAPIWTHVAVTASTLLVASVALIAIAGSLDRTRIRASFWFLFLILGGMIGLFAPGGIIFFLFPPLIAVAGMIAARWWRPAERVAAVVAVAVLYVTWGAMLGLLRELLNGGPMWIFAPLGSLIVIPALIEAESLAIRVGVRGAALVGGLIALAGWAVAAAVPAYSADRQQRFVIQHISDATHGRSWWSVLNDGAHLPSDFGGKWKRGKLALSDRPRWIATAPAEAVRAPDVQLVSQVVNGSGRTLTLRLIANGNEHVDLIAPPNAKLRSAGVVGFVRPIGGDEGKYAVGCFGRSCDGATVKVTTGQLKPIWFIVLGGVAGLPPSGAPLLASRPRFARPQYNRDETIAYAIRRL